MRPRNADGLVHCTTFLKSASLVKSRIVQLYVELDFTPLAGSLVRVAYLKPRLLSVKGTFSLLDKKVSPSGFCGNGPVVDLACALRPRPE